MKHSPMIQLTATRAALEAARETCPHWDYEADNGDTLHECCYQVYEANRAVTRSA